MKDDVISRQGAIDALRMDISIIPYAKAREYVRAAIETIYNRLEELPSAQSERKKGKWIDDGDPLTFKCDKCGYLVARYNNTNFCPNCGSYNGGEQE